MTKVYYIISFKAEGQLVYFTTSNECKSGCAGGTTDIFKAKWYDDLKSAQKTLNHHIMKRDKYFIADGRYTDYRLKEYTVEITANKEMPNE